MTVADQPLVLQFSEGRYVTPTVSPKPSGRGSWVYVWVRSKSGLVVYVGETSQDLVLRLRRSIGELAHTTSAQLRNNASITNLDLEQDFTVYAFPLQSPGGASAQTIKNYRRSVQAWVHWLICVGHRKHECLGV